MQEKVEGLQPGRPIDLKGGTKCTLFLTVEDMKTDWRLESREKTLTVVRIF